MKENFGCTMSSFWGGHVVEINTKNNSWKVVGWEFVKIIVEYPIC